MRKENFQKIFKKKIYPYTQPVSPKASKNRPILNLKSIELISHKLLTEKYILDPLFYGSTVINDIIYNERRHAVAMFKDYLIVDDLSEFLKRFYKINESLIRLPKYFDYYETYSRIYPNYTSIPESKYIYKNINKKQKMIDLLQEREQLEEEEKEDKKKRKRNKDEENDLQVFSTEVCNSIAEDSSFASSFFGITKNDNLNDSIEDINNIIDTINKYEIKSNSSQKPQKISTVLLREALNKNSKEGNTINNIYKSININIFNGIGGLSIGKEQKKRNFKNDSDLFFASYYPKTHRSDFSGEIQSSKIKVNMNNFDISKRNLNGECIEETGNKTERGQNKSNIDINNILNKNISKNTSKKDYFKNNFVQNILKNSSSSKRVPIGSPGNNSRNISSNKVNNHNPNNLKSNNVLKCNFKQKNSALSVLNKNLLNNYNYGSRPNSGSKKKILKGDNNILSNSKRVISTAKTNKMKGIIHVNLEQKSSGRNVFILNNMLSPRDIFTGGSQTARVRSNSKKSTNSNHSSSHFQVIKNNNKNGNTLINFGHTKNKSSVLNINKSNGNQKQMKIKGIEIKDFNRAINIMNDSPKIIITPTHKKTQSNTSRGLKYYNQNEYNIY
ncbi:MAG: hypothetical protein MJ252_08370 [archaeon]|nr:hypothetical protein [archaeon]